MHLKQVLLDVVFPPKCMVCGRFYPYKVSKPDKALKPDRYIATEAPPQAFSTRMTPFFCPTCRDDFTCMDRPVCSRCGKSLESRDDGKPVCDVCRRRPTHVGRVRAWGIYDGSLKTALHQLKYRSKTQLARPLGELLFSAFLRYWPDMDIDLVVPVPLHRRKFRQRGFNQAYLLIRQWPDLAAKWSRWLPEKMIQKSVLKRIRATDTQVGMNRGTRRTNLRHAFAMAAGSNVGGKRILLVDDVLTTGATADACAGVLRHAGAARIDVLTLAQTIRNR